MTFYTANLSTAQSDSQIQKKPTPGANASITKKWSCRKWFAIFNPQSKSKGRTMGLTKTLRFILRHPMNKAHPKITLTRFGKLLIQSRLRDDVIFDWIKGAKLVIRRGMNGPTGNIY